MLFDRDFLEDRIQLVTRTLRRSPVQSKAILFPAVSHTFSIRGIVRHEGAFNEKENSNENFDVIGGPELTESDYTDILIR